MSVTLQIRLNGGAPQTGGVTGAIGDVVQLTAANKSTWGGAARWEIYDYPPSFTVPAGWTADSDGVFYALGNADPPAFTISGSTNWGKYGFRVTVLDGAVLATDDATALSIPSAGGLRSIMAGESTQFGGTRERWVKDLKADLRALASGASGTVTPDPDELVLRDGSGRAFATAFRGPTSAAAVVSSQSGQDVHLDSADDVFLDVGAEGDAVRVQVAGSDAMTITPSAGTVTLAATARTIAVQSGVATNIELDSGRDVSAIAARDVILDVGSTSDEVSIRAGGATKLTITPGATTTTLLAPVGQGVEVSADANAKVTLSGNTATVYGADRVALDGDTDVTIAAGLVTATCSDSSGTYLVATNAPMHIQPAQAASGAGRALTIGGGAGQTPGTHLAGPLNIDLGTPVSGNSGIVDIRASGSSLAQMRAFVTDYLELTSQRTGGGLVLRATPVNGIVQIEANARVLCRQNNAAAGHFDISSNRTRRYNSGETVLFGTEIFGSATIASATTTNVVTFATVADRVYQCIGFLTVSNDTDNEGAAYWLRAAFKRVGGTVTQIGSTQTIAADLEDAGQTGLSAVLDFSGTDIRLRQVTDSADTVNVNGGLMVYERVLA